MKETIFNKIYTLGILIVVTLPLWNIPPLFDPPDWGKTMVFRIILSVLIFTALWHLSIVIQRTGLKEWARSLNFRTKEYIVLWLLLGLLGLFALATIFSLDQTISLWGNPVRSGGFVNFASYIIFALLAFFVLKAKAWQKTWDVVIITGVLIASIAIFQWQGWFEILLSTGRPPSTMGNSTVLAIYMLLLFFLSVSFSLIERKKTKKILYITSSLLFLFIITITEARAVYLGLSIASFYFFFFYPFKEVRRSVIVKILVILTLTLLIGSVYYINTQEKLPKFTKTNKILYTISNRINLDLLKSEPRFSAWKVGLNSIKDRPLFGYGPENFAVAFDQHYDPALPNIDKAPGAAFTSWWDRAHNMFIENAVQAGIPASLVYLLVFIVLLWQLGAAKKKIPEQAILLHGIQAIFIAYLVANFFSFDTFPVYLISFLLVAYSLFLIRPAPQSTEEYQEEIPTTNKKPYVKIGLLILAVIFLWFNWQYAIQPLRINTNLNVAKARAQTGSCERAFQLNEDTLNIPSTFLDGYVRIKYMDNLRTCEGQTEKTTLQIAEKGYRLLQENTVIWPYYTRNWLFLGQFTNVLIEQGEKTEAITPEEKEELLKRSNSFFERALELSPKRQEVYVEWTKTYIVSGDYQEAKRKAQECIDLNPRLGECWWLKGLAEEALAERGQSQSDIQMAIQKGFKTNTFTALSEIAEIYLVSLNLGGLARTYEKLIELRPDEVQLHAALAFTHFQIGNFVKAKAEALIVLQLDPEAREEVEFFLQILNEKIDNSQI